MSAWTRRKFIKTGAAGFAMAALGGRRLFAQSGPQSWDLTARPMPDVFRIGFGSCFRNSANTVPLSHVVARNPDVFVWLGDNIYADTTDPAVFKKKYAALGANPSFQALWNLCPNFASWDDHDFGLDDGGADFTGKDVSKEAFLEFWQVPENDPRRTRKGLYHSQLIGQGDRTVRLIQLDNRYFRTDRNKANATMLGEEQWTWLEEQLQAPATFKIITSGITVLPDVGWEGWHQYRGEQAKLKELIKRHNIEGVMFVTGDRHWSDLSRVTAGVNYPLYELCASSLDQSLAPQANPMRVGDVTNEPNFGMIEINWTDKVLGPLVTFQSYSAVTGKQIRDHAVRLNDLGLPKKFEETKTPEPDGGLKPLEPEPAKDTVAVVTPPQPEPEVPQPPTSVPVPVDTVTPPSPPPVGIDSTPTAPTPVVGIKGQEKPFGPGRAPQPAKLKGYTLDGRRIPWNYR